jgi:hypothetical protein
MRYFNKSMSSVSALVTAMLFANPAHAIQFSYLDPGYVQEIYAGPLVVGQEAGMA